MSIPLKRDPLTIKERDERLKELEMVIDRCHRGANTEWRAMVDLDWARRYERTIRLLEKEVSEAYKELELRLRDDLGNEIVDISFEILKGKEKPDVSIVMEPNPEMRPTKPKGDHSEWTREMGPHARGCNITRIWLALEFYVAAEFAANNRPFSDLGECTCFLDQTLALRAENHQLRKAMASEDEGKS